MERILTTLATVVKTAGVRIQLQYLVHRQIPLPNFLPEHSTSDTFRRTSGYIRSMCLVQSPVRTYGYPINIEIAMKPARACLDRSRRNSI